MKTPVNFDFDVIVVGAGPAGLACAHALAGHKLIVLDRAAAHGGRIRTIGLGAQRVDMGACFAFDAAVVPAGLPVAAGTLVRERADMAVHDGQRVHTAATPLGCLLKMGVDAPTLAQIEAVARQLTDANSLHGSRAYTLLESLLHQVHPGDLQDYAPQHQRDGLFSWHPDHWESGNGSLVDTLFAHSGAAFLGGADVRRVVDRGDQAEVTFIKDGDTRRLSARAAVIATTADVAAGLADWPDARFQRLFDATRYAAYVVVALAGPAAPALATFRSLVPLEGSPAVVVQQRSLDRQHAVLLSYWRGEEGVKLAAKTDTELVELCRQRLASLGLEPSALGALTECAVQRWLQGGTILSDDYRRARAELQEPRSGAVFIAGDYACGNDGAGYGVSDAVRSGQRAATAVRTCIGAASAVQARTRKAPPARSRRSKP